ncbi:atrial natriuretic peptide receptor 3-like [Physella acuta]|uniref:atrial natriuretic peptide receptor 3-like n=1 Tax=Physella acuta TaxID=109671 RepID=UPI0027DC7320|nr:atrial natriuretic peptide receptor 3-like [Physella acuta]
MYSLRLLYSLIFAFPLVYVHAEGVAHEIHVLWLAPREDQEDFTLASSMGPFALAVEESQNDTLLHNYTVNITWGDSACQPKAASGNFVRYFLSTRPDVIFGPPCTKAMVPVADLAAFFDIPVYSWVSHMHELDNKTEKSTLMRAIAPLSSLGDLLIFFCERMRWFHLSMIATVGELTEGMASFFKQTLEANDNFYLTRLHAGVKEGANRTQIEKIYNVIKTESRIIILVVPRLEVRKYLIVADEMGMTNGEYQFLYTERTVADKEFLASLTSPSFWQWGDGEDDKARRGYHNLLYLALASPARFRFSIRGFRKICNRKTAQWKFAQIEK